jgi:hypothetical protein
VKRAPDVYDERSPMLRRLEGKASARLTVQLCGGVLGLAGLYYFAAAVATALGWTD